MRDKRKGGFLLAAGVIFVAASMFVKDTYYACILRSWGMAWVAIGLLRLREYFYYKKPEHQAEYEEKETAAHYYKCAFTGIVLDWLNQDAAYDLAAFCENIYQLRERFQLMNVEYI